MTHDSHCRALRPRTTMPEDNEILISLPRTSEVLASDQVNQPMGNPEELIRCCQHCNHAYNFAERGPRCLPCGDTLCSECISEGLNNNILRCPICENEHMARRHTDFPTNQLLEIIIKKFVSQPATAPAGGLSEELKCRRRDLGKEMESIRVSSRELSLQLDQYHSILRTWKEQHSALIYRHKDIIHDIEKECIRVTDAIEENEEDRQKLKVADEELFAVNTEPDFVLAAEQAQLRYKVIDNWICSTQPDFPNSELAEKSTKFRAGAQMPLSGEIISASGDSQCHSQQNSSSAEICPSSSSDTHNPCSLIDDLERLVRISSASKDNEEKSVQTDDDKWHIQNLGLNVEAMKRIVSLLSIPELRISSIDYIKKDVGRELFGKLSIRSRHLCMSAYSDETPPSYASFVKYDALPLPQRSDTKLVFLEFKLFRRYVAEIFIRLASGTKRAQNFLLLCTGELGKSFLDTNIRKVWRKGCPGEFVQCGPEGMCLVRGAGQEEGGVLERPDVEGSVYGYSGDELGCLFSITTVDNQSDSYSTVFGHVISGLDQLKKALSEYPSEDDSENSLNIKNVKVTDCGVVLAENY